MFLSLLKVLIFFEVKNDMANSHSVSDLRVNRIKILRMVLVLVGLLMICYVERRSKKYSSALAISCSPCSCDCVSDTTLLSMPSGEIAYFLLKIIARYFFNAFLIVLFGSMVVC